MKKRKVIVPRRREGIWRCRWEDGEPILAHVRYGGTCVDFRFKDGVTTGTSVKNPSIEFIEHLGSPLALLKASGL